MKFFNKCKDGGPDSPVIGYFLVEIKSLFSIVLIHFDGSRENFHSHAFNCLTLWLKGEAKEQLKDDTVRTWKAGQFKYTPRDCFHKVGPKKDTWALSVRGPWVNTWQEYNESRRQLTTLTNGRKIVSTQEVA